jgi:hypothetical protein
MSQLSYDAKHLVPQCIERSDGIGPVIELGALRGKLLGNARNQRRARTGRLGHLYMGLCVRTEWDTKPLLSFPQKSYCGVYAIFLNLASYPTVRFLRVEWKMSRRDKRDSRLMFGFYVSLEESLSRVNAAVA